MENESQNAVTEGRKMLGATKVSFARGPNALND
jgi:hypothetical protein